MFLSRIHLDPRCKEVRRDLSDPYQLHSTICRAFSPPNKKCPESMLMWRLEPEKSSNGSPRVLVQSRVIPEWPCIGIKRWLLKADPPIDLRERLNFDSIEKGQRFRFRLKANPCVKRNGKRIGLLKINEQESWIERKSAQHGFSLSKSTRSDFLESDHKFVGVWISHDQMLWGKQHNGNRIAIFSVMYEGVLNVTESKIFKDAIRTGIGHGKVMGLGLLSVAPIDKIKIK